MKQAEEISCSQDTKHTHIYKDKNPRGRKFGEHRISSGVEVLGMSIQVCY